MYLILNISITLNDFQISCNIIITYSLKKRKMKNLTAIIKSVYQICNM